MTPDGRTLLVGVYGEDRVAFVDTATSTVVGSVAVAKPHTIAVRPDGKVAYVASQEPGKFALVVVDLAARRCCARSRWTSRRATPNSLPTARALYFTLAGINAVQVLDPATDKIVAQIPTGASPHIAALFSGAAAGTVVVQGPGELLLFDPATNAPLRSIAVGKQPHWMAATRDGRGLRHQRRFERRQRRRSRRGHGDHDRGRQRAAQGRRAARCGQGARAPRSRSRISRSLPLT